MANLQSRAALQPQTFTIGKLARAANVGVETIRYYQARELLPVPGSAGSYRQYPVALVSRIRFIKRAQELGFSLDEIASLLELQDGADRKSIRAIAGARAAQIEAKIADLQRMQQTIRHLLHECEHTRANVPCPIIEAIATEQH